MRAGSLSLRERGPRRAAVEVVPITKQRKCLHRVGRNVGPTERTWRDRYLSDPADKVKDWFVSAADKASDTLGDLRERSADAATGAVTAVRKGISKLRFW